MDLKATLDLLETAPPLGSRPDMTRVASLGFSLGGYTALGLGGVRVQRDAFIIHCAAKPQAVDYAWMVAAAVEREALAGLDHPFLIVNQGAPATLPEGLDASALAAAIPGAEHVAIPGAAYFSFLAECSTLAVIIFGPAGEDNICSDRGLRDRGWSMTSRGRRSQAS